MKIVYCIIDCSQTGGMERIISCKANYLADVLGHEVKIITTDQSDRSNYYDFSSKIEFYDLGINYNELEQYSFVKRIWEQLKKRKEHKLKLSQILKKWQADIVISTYSHEFTLLHNISDNSRKIAEIHFSKEHSVIGNKYKKQSILLKIKSLLAECRKYLYIKKYEKFIVLTKKDKENFSRVSNSEQIPNMYSFYPEKSADLNSKRIISVGRLSVEKRFDLLIEAWSMISEEFPDWRLDIFGMGDEYSKLEKLIDTKHLNDVIKINSPTKNIVNEYLNSSIFVMTSCYEGFPMVLLEAMACGVPCVSFDCPHGPSAIITDKEDGFLVENGNVALLAEKVKLLIQNENLRIEMGKKAKENVKRFSPDIIMKQWDNLFQQLTLNKNTPINEKMII